jgi:hypothetical protein
MGLRPSGSRDDLTVLALPWRRCQSGLRPVLPACWVGPEPPPSPSGKGHRRLSGRAESIAILRVREEWRTTAPPRSSEQVAEAGDRAPSGETGRLSGSLVVCAASNPARHLGSSTAPRRPSGPMRGAGPIPRDVARPTPIPLPSGIGRDRLRSSLRAASAVPASADPRVASRASGSSEPDKAEKLCLSTALGRSGHRADVGCRW